MIRILVDILALVAAFVAGGFFEPKVATWFKSWTAARAVTAAKALVAKAEADVAALENAKKVVAAQPKPATPVATAAAGPTGS